VPSADYVRRMNEIPPLKKEVQQFVKKSAPEEGRAVNEGMMASAMEFILEGLYVENRLNKTHKNGEAVFKR
jgi:hypothetical protein